MNRQPSSSGSVPARAIRRAARILSGGGVVAIPTETVYGLAANAYDANAVARVFEIKRRPRFDPLIVHVSSAEEAHSIVTVFPDQAVQLARRFWPGPLTLVLPKDERIPDIVTAGLPTVAVRVPDHPLALGLIREAGVPLAAPSANPFGRVSPTTAAHVREQLGDQVDMVLDGGPCRVGIESTIILLGDGPPRLLRAGGVAVEEIEALVGPVVRVAAEADRPLAPGQLPRHYAPRTPLVLYEEVVRPPSALRAGLLAFGPSANTEGFAAVEVLSGSRDLREAAANLFSAIHRLDALGLDVIVAERVPDVGLGLAINERLSRASRVTTETDSTRRAVT